MKNLTSLKISQLRSTIGSKKKTITFVIPKEIGGLTNLKQLHFENVVVSSVPTSVQDLSNLQELTFLNCWYVIKYVMVMYLTPLQLIQFASGGSKLGKIDQHQFAR